MSVLALLGALLAAGAGHSQTLAARPSLAQPSLSPDGKEIAFVSGGDIWAAPAQGGTAHLLVSHPATEERPIYSPKGDQLAFSSTRDGAANLYVLTFATGVVRRLTFADSNERLDGWSPDGRWVYFSSNAGDVGGQNDIYRVAAAGGTPLPVSAESFLSEFNSAPSPDGQQIALMAKGGQAISQWWRNGHSHLDETELWLKPITASGAYRRLLPATAKHLWPMWSPDGRTLYFMSDESGAENLWRLRVGEGTPQKLTNFTSGRVLFPSIAADGRSIVFERNFEIWRADTAGGQASRVDLTLRGSPSAAGVRHLTETRFQEMALSPDGKKVAVSAHGQIFAASAKDGGAGERISQAADEASWPIWAADSNALVYVAQQGLDSQLIRYDFRTRQSKPLTSGHFVNAAPAFSPDGKMIAYQRGANELRVITLAADGSVTKDAVLFGEMRETDPQKPTWSPDSQWVAFGVIDRRAFRNIYVVPAAGGAPRPITFLANGQTASRIAWSGDGKYIVFDTAQRSEPVQLVRVDLLPNLPKYREDQFNELFKPEQTNPDKTEKPAPAKPQTPPPPGEPGPGGADKPEAKAEPADKPEAKAPKPKVDPVRIVFEDIRRRATIIPLGLSAEAPMISPDGKTLVFRANLLGQPNLYTYDLDELLKEPAVPKQLTSSKGGKAHLAFSPDSKALYWLDGGVLNTSPLDNPRSKAISIEAELNVDFDEEKLVVFSQAWDALNRNFFDPKFNGQDWGALHARWAPYIAGVRTSDELRRDINLMIGELNASHSGINPAAGPPSRIADLGLAFDREAFEAGRGLVVTRVVSLGPADQDGAIKVGDTVLAINGEALRPTSNLGALLLDRTDKRTVLSVQSPGGKPREVVVKPVSSGAASGLRYRDWVEGRRAYVERVSGGRLGYVHLADMSSDSLAQLYLDLDAQNQARDGVVIDVRNNNGGFVNGYVLDVFSRKNFLQMTPRELYALPSRQALGQRALGLPTVLVTNEGSLSDAEDFTEGYRALGLGKVVGVPTAGWIIYTSPQRLIDGSSVRLPSTRIQDAKGGDLEMHPRPVDVLVERPLGETASGRDAQLDAAVAELLKTLPSKRN